MQYSATVVLGAVVALTSASSDHSLTGTRVEATTRWTFTDAPVPTPTAIAKPDQHWELDCFAGMAYFECFEVHGTRCTDKGAMVNQNPFECNEMKCKCRIFEDAPCNDAFNKTERHCAWFPAPNDNPIGNPTDGRVGCQPTSSGEAPCVMVGFATPVANASSTAIATSTAQASRSRASQGSSVTAPAMLPSTVQSSPVFASETVSQQDPAGEPIPSSFVNPTFDFTIPGFFTYTAPRDSSASPIIGHESASQQTDEPTPTLPAFTLTDLFTEDASIFHPHHSHTPFGFSQFETTVSRARTLAAASGFQSGAAISRRHGDDEQPETETVFATVTVHVSKSKSSSSQLLTQAAPETETVTVTVHKSKATGSIETPSSQTQVFGSAVRSTLLTLTRSQASGVKSSAVPSHSDSD